MASANAVAMWLALGVLAACSPKTAPPNPPPVPPEASAKATRPGPAAPPAAPAPEGSEHPAPGSPDDDPAPADEGPPPAPVEPPPVTLPPDTRRLGTLAKSGRYQGWTIARLVFSPDGEHLAVASEPIGDTRTVVRVFAVATGRRTMVLHSRDAASGLAFSPDGRRLAVVGVGRSPAGLYDPRDGRHLADLEGTGGAPPSDWRVGVSFTFSVDGQQVYTDDGVGVICSALDGTLRSRHGTAWLTNPNIVPMINGHVLFRQHIRDGQWVSGLDVHDAATGRRLRTIDPGDAVWYALADLAPRLAVARVEGGVQVWDCATGAPIADVPVTGRVTRMALDPAGSALVAATVDDRLGAWIVADGWPLLDVTLGALGVREVAIAPAGRHVAAALPDGTVALWTPAVRPT